MTPAEKRKEFVEAVRNGCRGMLHCKSCVLDKHILACEFAHHQGRLCDLEALAMFAYPDEEAQNDES